MFDNQEKIIINDMLGIAITENCNLKCEHCLCGERRNTVMSKEVIDTLLSQVKINGRIHLTGGEPFMYMDTVIYFLEQLFECGNRPKKVTATTNGTIDAEEIRRLMRVLAANDTSLILFISNDFYHIKEHLRKKYGEEGLYDRLALLHAEYEYGQEYGSGIQKSPYRHLMEVHYQYWNLKREEYPSHSEAYASIRLEEYRSFEEGRGLSAIGNAVNIPAARIIVPRELGIARKVRLSDNQVIGEFMVQVDGRVTTNKDISWDEIDENYDQDQSIMTRSLRDIIKNPYL